MITTPAPAYFPDSAVSAVPLADASIAVETAGPAGDAPFLLLHGFPHTRAIWRSVAAGLVAAGRRVIAPDLRGLGDSDRTAGGYGARAGAADQRSLLDMLGVERAHVVGLDLGVATAFGLAAWDSERVVSLTLIEGLVGALPGAEAMQAGGGPWWFGFHRAPGGLAEAVVDGAEERYVRFFLGIGSARGVSEDLVAAIVRAYTGTDSLRAAFEHYRAMPADARDIADWSRSGRLTMPVLTVGAQPVGDATRRQLEPFADRLTSLLVDGSAHIVPVDAPEQLVEALLTHAKRASSEA